MSFADIFLAELDKIETDLAPMHKHIAVIGRELAKRYKDQQETLATIATLYVKESRS